MDNPNSRPRSNNRGRGRGNRGRQQFRDVSRESAGSPQLQPQQGKNKKENKANKSDSSEVEVDFLAPPDPMELLDIFRNHTEELKDVQNRVIKKFIRMKTEIKKMQDDNSQVEQNVEWVVEKNKELRKKLKALRGDKNRLSEEVEKLKNDVSEMKCGDEKLKSEVEEMKERIRTLSEFHLRKEEALPEGLRVEIEKTKNR